MSDVRPWKARREFTCTKELVRDSGESTEGDIPGCIIGAPSPAAGRTDPLGPATGSRLRATMGAPGIGGPPTAGGATALALALAIGAC